MQPTARSPLIHLLAVAGVVCISFSGIFFLKAEVAPATATFFRCLYAIPLLFGAYLAVKDRDQRPAAARRLAFLSGILLSIDLTLWHHAIDLIGAGLGTVLGNTQVMFVGLAAWLVWKEQPSRIAVYTVPFVLFGVALLSGLGRDDAYGDDPLGGVLFGIATGVAYAGFLLVFRASNRHHLAPTPGPMLDATAGAVVGALVAGLVSTEFSVAWSWPAHGWLIALAVLVQVAGWLMIATALPRLAALETSVLLLVQPVAALLWARILLAETLSLIQGIGVVIVLSGIVLVSTRGSVRRPSPHTVPAPSS